MTNQGCQSIISRTKKLIIPTNFHCFHAINSVLLSRLLHLLGFYHWDVILSEIVLITAGLLELDYFFHCSYWLTEPRPHIGGIPLKNKQK